MKIDLGFFDENGQYKEDIQEIEMLSVKELNEIELIKAQNEGLKKQNAELQQEVAQLKAENERLKEEFEIESLTEHTTGETIYRSNLINNLQKVSGSFANLSEAFRNTMNKYKSCLQEIKDLLKGQVWRIGDDKTIEQILQKISDCEVE